MILLWPAAGYWRSTLSHARRCDGHVENAHLALPQLRWRRDALQPPEIQRVRRDRNTCVHIPDGGLRCVTWNMRGLQGRDHIVSIRSRDRNLVVVNVHFDPDLTLRSLRERQRLLTPHWPLYPEAIGVITGTSIFASQMKEDSIFAIGPSLTEIRERPPSSTPLFLTSSKSLSPTLPRENLQPTAQYDHCPELIDCNSHVLENLGEWFIPSDHAAVRIMFKNRTFRCNQGKRIPRMCKHSGCSQL